MDASQGDLKQEIASKGLANRTPSIVCLVCGYEVVGVRGGI